MSEPAGRELTAREQSLFTAYFAALRAQKIPFVLLRNYEEFPARIGHDLDLFVRRQDVRAAGVLFDNLLAAAGGETVIIHERDYFLDVRFVLGTPVTEALHLDLYHGAFTWHGLPYLSESALLSGAREHRQWLVPRPAHEALNVFLASILWGGFYQPRYQPRIAALLSDPAEYTEFQECLQRAFGPDSSPPFDFRASVPSDRTVVRTYAARLRRSFKAQSFRHSPLLASARLVRYWVAELSSLARPKGLALAVCGPDPERNAPVIEGIVQRLGELFGERHLERWDPAASSAGLPAASRGALRLLHSWLHIRLRWPRAVRKQRAQVHLLLFDGCAADWWCDASRHGFARLPTWLLKIAAGTLPEPDFTFVLTDPVPAQGVGDRAQRNACYRAWAEGDPRRHPVDATLPPAKVLDCVERIVVTYLRNRERSR